MKGVEILTPGDPGKEFLLGDIPAITIASAMGQFGPSNGVTVDEADMIFMPLTPRLLVVIGPANAARTISDADVDVFNQMQVREASPGWNRRTLAGSSRCSMQLTMSSWSAGALSAAES